jgi:hypothetical protein
MRPLPAPLILSLLLLSGCIFVPARERPVSAAQRDIPALLGSADSDQPLRVGTSRAAVLSLLGTPARERNDNRSIAYGYATDRGQWIPLFPGSSGSNEVVRWYVVRLDFDDRDRLAAWEIRRTSEPGLMYQEVSLRDLDELLPRKDARTNLAGYDRFIRQSAKMPASGD